MAESSKQEIIREYLVKLGYVVDKQEKHDFDASVISSEKVVATLGKGLLLAATAATAMASKFALSMDSLYYASQKANSSAANMRAFEYAGRQIGLTGEAIDSMVQSLAMTLRTDPGMKGWVESLGVTADESRQGVDIWLDLMSKLRSKPFYEGRQFAEMIGMSPEQFFQVETNYDLFLSKIKERKQMASDAGLDQDKAALAGRNLANEAGRAIEKGSILFDKAGAAAAPTLIDAGNNLNKAADALMRVATGKGLTDDQKAMNDVNHPWWSKHQDQSKPATSLLGSQPAWMDRLNDLFFGHGSKVSKDAPQAAKFFEGLERTWGLDAGSLDHIWKKESNRGDPRFLLSPKGAAGPFGFMPGTAAQYGVKDRYDFDQSATGAAHYLSDLKKKYGTTELAMQAYNWGPAHMDRYLGAKAQGKPAAMPNETKRYYDPAMVAKPIIINVSGAQSPAQTAKAVRKELDLAAADQQRYATGAVR